MDISNRSCRVCGCKLKPKYEEDYRRTKDKFYDEKDRYLLPDRYENIRPKIIVICCRKCHIAREQELSKLYVTDGHIKIASDCKCSSKKPCRYCYIKNICMQALQAYSSRGEKDSSQYWDGKTSKRFNGKALDRTLIDHNAHISQKLPTTDASKQHSSKSTADQMSAKDRIAASKFVSVSGSNGQSPGILQERSRSGRDDTYSEKQSSSRQEQRVRDHSDLDITHKLYFERDMPGRRDQQTSSDFGVVTLNNSNGKRAPAHKNIRKKEQQMQAVPQFNRLDETGVDDHLRVRLENMALKKTPREELQRMFRCRPCFCPISQVNYCISTSNTLKPVCVPANCLFIPACGRS